MQDHDSANYEKVSARPVKSFLVEMLIRDIKLEESVLDLLDNCVDGILRTKKPKMVYLIIGPRKR